MKRQLLALLALLALTATLAQAETPPNFIIIYADDLGYSQLGLSMMMDKPEYAHPLHQTPNIKKIDERGMRFSNAYAPSPVCTSSRTSIQFGKTTARVGCISLNDVVAAKKGVDLTKNLSIAEMLKEANKGYHTAFFGKGCSPMGRFKDHGYHVTDFNSKNPNGNAHGDWWEPSDRTPIPADDPKRMFSLARTSIDYLNERAADKKPFYMMVSHYALHVHNTSLKSTREKYLKIIAKRDGISGGISDGSGSDKEAASISKKLKSLWGRANYAAMVEDMDTSIGMVLDELKALGMEDNTYVIFASDNGGGQGNPPLQGGKAKMWEGGLRTPMIVAGPGIKANSQCDVPVAQWDFLTTMHDLCGSPAALPDDLDGVSLRPVLENGNAGKLAERDAGMVFHFPAYYTVPITAYRDGDLKLMRHLNTGEIKLFNVAEDPGESKDLSESMPEQTAAMISKLDAYLLKVGAWTMDEVCETRLDGLRKGMPRGTKELEDLKQKLASNPGDQKLKASLKKAQGSLEKRRTNIGKVITNQKSDRWR